MFVILIHFKDSLVECKILDSYFLSMISFLKNIYLFLPVKGLCCCMDFSVVAESGAALELWCTGLSLQWLVLWQSMGSGTHGLQWLGQVG